MNKFLLGLLLLIAPFLILEIEADDSAFNIEAIASTLQPFYCEGEDVSLLGSVTVGAVNPTFDWTGPGFTSDVQNPSGQLQAGDYILIVTDDNCVSEPDTVTVEIRPNKSFDYVEPFCLGDPDVIVGTEIFNEFNQSGTVILEGQASNGCDSIVNVLLSTLASILGSFDTEGAICDSQQIDLVFNLTPPSIGPFNVTYINDLGDTFYLIDIFDGHRITLEPTVDVIYTMIDITSNATSCEPIIGTQAVINVSNLQTTFALSSYNGDYNVSCPDEADGMIILDVMSGVEPYEYAWSNGNDEAFDDNLFAGLYRITITDDTGCSEVVDIFLEGPPEPTLSAKWEFPSCPGIADGSFTIDSVFDGLGPYELSFNGAAFEPAMPNLFFSDLIADEYVVIVRDDIGCEKEFILRGNNPPPPFVDLGDDIDLIAGDDEQLGFTTDLVPVDIMWSPLTDISCTDCANPTVNPIETTTYSVTVTDDIGCSAEDEIIVNVFIPKRVFLPNIFTPNNDGINDVWFIGANEFVDIIENVEIYDRWGEQVFQKSNILPNDPAEGWDGKLKGTRLHNGVYTYIATLVFRDGIERTYKGTITIIQ